jgi:hypothetical protein
MKRTGKREVAVSYERRLVGLSFKTVSSFSGAQALRRAGLRLDRL